MFYNIYGGNTMCAELTKSESSLNFHLDGESQIDAKLLSRIINDFAELTQCAAKDIDHEVLNGVAVQVAEHEPHHEQGE